MRDARGRRFAAAAAAVAAALAGVAVGLAGCGSTAGAGSGGRVLVVAAESFWGSIAAQLGGDRVDTVSVVSNPDADPHAYEPTAADARAMAEAQYVVLNGAGYDPWAQRLVDAGPSDGRTVLSVAGLAGRSEGDNPHMWYAPAIVARVVDRMTSDLQHLDAADATYFEARRQAFTSTALGPYDSLRARIRATYGGVPVGATESIFADLAQDLGLDLLTPPDYMRAVSEGTDASAGDKSTVDAQISERRIDVLVFNRQNSTTDIQALVDAATAAGIPVVAITETLDPATATFQDWQTSQLQALAKALAKATGR